MYVSKRKDGNDADKRKKIFTLLFFRASARYRAPFLPIPFHGRFSAISVCVRRKRCTQQREKNKDTDLIIFQSTSQILGPFLTDFIACEIECDQCLCRKENVQTTETKEKRYSPYSFREHQLDIGPHSRRFDCKRD